MNSPVLAVNDLAKSYPCGRHALFPSRRPSFVALSGVSFELYAGDTLGVLGVNGAGKSTLLKLIAGVSAPTSGTVAINGKTGAILELGAGFCPEYTGRENAMLTLAIAGVKKKDAAHALAYVEEFADIGDFFDMPVRTYSSGMFVRLAFACATAATPDLLLVDEALSVGDLFFQAKCVRRMKELLANGVTLLFVSHDLSAVKSVCKRCLLLNGGKVELLGPTDIVANRYFELKAQAEQPRLREAKQRPLDEKATKGRLGDGRARFVAVTLEDDAQNPIESAAYGQMLTLRMRVEAKADLPRVTLGYHIQNGAGADVVYCDTAIAEKDATNWSKGETHELKWRFCARLGEGSHNIAAVCSVPIDMERGEAEFCDYIHNAAQFSMERRQGAKIYGMTSWENEVTMCKQ